MPVTRHIDETNYNTHLAALLGKRMPGWETDAQAVKTISRGKTGYRKPDLMLSAPDGTSVAVEAKYDKPGNLSKLDEQTRCQVERTVNGQELGSAVLVLYPRALGSARAGLEMESLDAEQNLRFASWSAGKDEPVRFPKAGYLTGGLDRLADFIETAADSEHRSARLTTLFSNAVTAAADILGGRFPEMAEIVKQEPGEQTDQMMSALMLNALIFHYSVAEYHQEVNPPALSDDIGLRQSVLKKWAAILEINYWPIFSIASDLLEAINSEKTANRFLERLIETASLMARKNAHTVQNLTGQVFGTLLADRKFLASFYTLPAPAALLAELAVSRLDVDWSDAEAVTGLKIADFACGTGALLSAAYGRIRSRVRRQGYDDKGLHQKMLEEVLIGCDIMPAAVHITASTLSSAHPSVDYTKTETHVMPIGPYRDDPSDIKTGSLELIAVSDTATLFGDGSEAVMAKGENGGGLTVEHGSCDLVTMNPPYTAPTNHTRKDRQKSALPQFAAFGMTKSMQKKIGKKVKKMVNNLDVKASNGNAGLGTDFFDLAHRKVKIGGVIAFVLPATVIAGPAWGALRRILAAEYENVTFVTCSSGKNKHRRFSSDTDLAETLLLATRRKEPRPEGDEEDWQWVNLNQNPKSIAEALELAEKIKTTGVSPDSLSSAKIGDINWGFQVKASRAIAPALVRYQEVAEALLTLTDSDRPGLDLHRFNRFVDLPLTRLGDVGTPGIGDRDLVRTRLSGDRGPFDFLPHPGGKTEFPALWNHHWRDETRLVVQPDKHGRPIRGREQLAADRWQQVTRLHFTCEFTFSSQPLAACLTPEPALGGRAWPSFVLHADGDPAVERMDWVYPVLLWANTTLGLMSFYALGYRSQPQRSVVKLTKLPGLLVLDPRSLTPDQLRKAEDIFNKFTTGEFSGLEFKPANKAAWDDTRKQLDEAVLTDLLGYGQDVLNRVDVIRGQWCNEPHLTGAE